MAAVAVEIKGAVTREVKEREDRGRKGGDGR